MELVCIAKFIAKNGKEKKLKDVLESLILPTRKEIGCNRYELNIAIDNPKEIIYIEKWKDEDRFNAHCNSEYIVNYFNNQMLNLIDGFDVKLYKETTQSKEINYTNEVNLLVK